VLCLNLSVVAPDLCSALLYLSSGCFNACRRFKDFPKALLTLLKNPTFVCLGVAGGIDSLTINGLATFGPKYLETIFGFGPSAAGLYFGKACLF